MLPVCQELNQWQRAFLIETCGKIFQRYLCDLEGQTSQCLNHLDISKSYSWPFVVILLNVTTNYYPKIYAEISLINSTLRRRKKVQFLPVGL